MTRITGRAFLTVLKFLSRVPRDVAENGCSAERQEDNMEKRKFLSGWLKSKLRALLLTLTGFGLGTMVSCSRRRHHQNPFLRQQ